MEIVKHYLLLAIPLFLISILLACASPAPTSTPAPTPTPTLEPVVVSSELGAQLTRDLGCTACHSAEGHPSVGPTWRGLFDSQRPLADGSTVLADEAYIRESILDPNAKIADGFLPGIMPQNFGDRLSEPEVLAIIEYFKTLG